MQTCTQTLATRSLHSNGEHPVAIFPAELVYGTTEGLVATVSYGVAMVGVVRGVADRVRSRDRDIAFFELVLEGGHGGDHGGMIRCGGAGHGVVFLNWENHSMSTGDKIIPWRSQGRRGQMTSSCSLHQVALQRLVSSAIDPQVSDIGCLACWGLEAIACSHKLSLEPVGIGSAYLGGNVAAACPVAVGQREPDCGVRCGHGGGGCELRESYHVDMRSYGDARCNS